jgi:hypothetical protein
MSPLDRPAISDNLDHEEHMSDKPTLKTKLFRMTDDDEKALQSLQYHHGDRHEAPTVRRLIRKAYEELGGMAPDVPSR